MFYEWVKNHEDYDHEIREPKGMDGCLEEHLNAFIHYKDKTEGFAQLDLMIPIKNK